MITKQTFIAVNRFGLGARPGEMKTVSLNHRGWLLNQIMSGKQAALISGPNTEALAKKFTKFDRDKASTAEKEKLNKKLNDSYQREMKARFDHALLTEQPFIERLVRFWSNHFTISVKAKASLRLLAGVYEREAIRPHVLGSFSEMLLAVTRHPAMLLYLDNVTSIGPNSRAGKYKGRGLNENLAREILELHTLGVDGGYSQGDVISLAKIITGWAILPPKKGGKGYEYIDLMHEPGTHTLLGKTYAQHGEKQGIAALNDLARHPSTARFIATKLACHFIADEPPVSAINKLADVFMRTGGDLKALAIALIDLPEVWTESLPKVKSPTEMMISSLRLFGLNEDVPHDKILKSLALLDQIPFGALSPAGWSDQAEDWISPNSIMNRVEWCHAISLKVAGMGINPLDLARETFGPVASPETLTWISRAPSPADGLALLMTSPEFQRR